MKLKSTDILKTVELTHDEYAQLKTLVGSPPSVGKKLTDWYHKANLALSFITSDSPHSNVISVSVSGDKITLTEKPSHLTSSWGIVFVCTTDPVIVRGKK